jgi:hypothetical protein
MANKLKDLKNQYKAKIAESEEGYEHLSDQDVEDAVVIDNVDLMDIEGDDMLDVKLESVRNVESQSFPKRMDEGLAGPYRSVRNHVYYYDESTKQLFDAENEQYVTTQESYRVTSINSKNTLEVYNYSRKDFAEKRLAAIRENGGKGYILKDARVVSSLQTEASKYQIFHNTYSSAMQHALKQAEKRGYEVDMDDYERKVAFGPKKPSSGKTNSFSIKLTKGGKPQKKALQVQVYNMDNKKYELNMYIESFVVTEEVIAEANVLATIKDIVKTKSAKPVKFDDGKSMKVDMQTANVILKVFDALNDTNKKKVETMLNKDKANFGKFIDFAWKSVK